MSSGIILETFLAILLAFIWLAEQGSTVLDHQRTTRFEKFCSLVRDFRFFLRFFCTCPIRHPLDPGPFSFGPWIPVPEFPSVGPAIAKMANDNKTVFIFKKIFQTDNLTLEKIQENLCSRNFFDLEISRQNFMTRRNFMTKFHGPSDSGSPSTFRCSI